MTRSLTMNDYRAEVWTAQKTGGTVFFIVLVLVLFQLFEDEDDDEDEDD